MLVALLLMAAAAGSPAKQMPVDECRDPSFAEFRAHFEQIVKKRDFEGLAEMVASDAELYMAGSVVPENQPTSGRDGFLAKFNNGSDPALWENLTQILRLGCTSVEDSRSFPSVPEGLDLDEYLVVVPGTPLLRRPSSKSPVVARLAWNVVKDIGTPEGAAYKHVRLPDGRTGYLRRDKLRSEYEDDSVWFEKRGGRWLLTSLAPMEP